MHVIEQTPTKLILYDRSVLKNWRVGCLYTLGTTAVFAILGAPLTSAFIWAVQSTWTEELMTTFKCDRTQSLVDTCQIVRSHLIGQDVITIPLDTLQIAVVDSKRLPSNTRGTNKFYSVYYVSLRTNTRSIPLTKPKSLEKTNQEKYAAQINHFINNQNERSLKIQQQGTSVFILFIAAAIGLLPILPPLSIMSLAMFYSLRVTLCIFDKTTGMMTLKHKPILGLFETKVIQCPLEKIVDIQLKAFPGRGEFWKLELILAEDDPISLSWMETSGKEEKQAAIADIRRFLNL